jgi:asparagine synthase (glutamine-hydrolysing)
MCGLSGYLVFSGGAGSTRSTDATDVLWAMNRAISHRGPDGEGALFIDSGTGSLTPFAGVRTAMMSADLPQCPRNHRVPHDLALGHQRFAILDPTPGGHQPLVLAEEKLALVFTGEIYNHVELREELSRSGSVFRTRGDAEVLAHAWLQWGEACLPRLRGFFAIALWDGRTRSLWLARDPIGKAPLYWARHAGRLWWSSEIKGLRAGAGQGVFPPRPQAVAEFVDAGLRDFGDKTFFEGIETFPAGSVARIAADGTFTPRRYWSPPDVRLRASELSPQEAISGLKERLHESVRLRLRADVPVGLELSGGMDSSAIAAVAAREQEKNFPGASPLNAYTVGFAGTSWDESAYARKVAAHHPQRLKLTELPYDRMVSVEALARYHKQMDEPFHSPALLVNREMWRRMAATGLKVSLNGGGGDEVFAGYGGEYLGPFARGLFARGRVAQGLRELGAYSERDPRALRAWARSAWWMVPEGWRKGLRPGRPAAESFPLLTRMPVPRASDDLEQRLLDHLGPYKMNYWLRSGNTSCMGLPVEVRLPLLDTRVVEWAARMPVEYLIRDGWLKWVLRKAVEPDLPSDVTWRRVKMGFPFPIREWLRTARPALETLLRHGEDPPLISRARVFDNYEKLAATHPAHLWRSLSVLMWWDVSVADGGSSDGTFDRLHGEVPDVAQAAHQIRRRGREPAAKLPTASARG